MTAPASSPDAFLLKNEEAYRNVLYSLEMLALQLELAKSAPDDVLPLMARARDMMKRLEFCDGRPLRQGPDKRYVYWIERRGRRMFLQATPIDVSNSSMTAYSTKSTPWS